MPDLVPWWWAVLIGVTVPSAAVVAACVVIGSRGEDVWKVAMQKEKSGE